MKKDKLLFLSPRIPYPLDTGGKIRTYHILRLLAQRYDVDLVSFFFSPVDEVSARNLEDIQGIRCCGVPSKDNIFTIAAKAVLSGRPISYQRYISRDFIFLLKVLARKNNYSLAHCDHLHMGQYVDILRSIFPDISVRVDEHNVEYVIAERARKKEASFLKRIVFMRESRLIKALEASICSKADEVWVVSEDDKELLARLSGVKAVVVPNGVDLDFFSFRPYSDSEKGIVFIGSMDWLPNEDGMLYFLKEIWPIILRHTPDIALYIVGRNPSSRITEFASNQVVVTGSVDDVRPYLYNSVLSIVPLRIGGGSRLKILESMSAGRVVISTSLGAEGIEYSRGENILIEDSPERFAAAVAELYFDIERRKKMAESARKLVEERYSWRLPEP